MLPIQPMYLTSPLELMVPMEFDPGGFSHLETANDVS